MSPTSSLSLIYAELSINDLGPPCSNRLIMTSVITYSGNFPECLASSTVLNIQRRKPGINMHHLLICDTCKHNQKLDLAFVQLINYIIHHV